LSKLLLKVSNFNLPHLYLALPLGVTLANFVDVSGTQKLDFYTMSQKTRHQTLGHNFTKYYPIFKIFSLRLGSKFAADSCLNVPPRFKHVATLPCEI